MAGTRCRVCDHAERKAIDIALAVTSERTIAARYGLSKSSVHRHKLNDLRPGLARAAELREELSMDQLVSKLQNYIERLENGMAKAESASDLVGLSRLVKEAGALVVRLGQLQGSWSDRPQIDNRKLTINNYAKLTEDELRALAASYKALPC